MMHANSAPRRAMGRNVRGLCVAALALLPVAMAQPAAAHEKSVVLAYAGVLDLNNGLDTRVYQGGFVDLYTADDVGFHADFVHVDREEDATYFAGGISIPLTPHIRPKLMVGSSTRNNAILPDAFVSFIVQVKPGHDSGWVVSPGIAYRHYRNGVDETSASLAVAKYFTMPWDSHGYYAAQASVATTIGNRGRARGSVTAGLQTVRHGGVSFGVSAEGGALVRDPIGGTSDAGRFFAVRPNLSVPVFDGVEVFARGEYADTALYTAKGATTGVKVGF